MSHRQTKLAVGEGVEAMWGETPSPQPLKELGEVAEQCHVKQAHHHSSMPDSDQFVICSLSQHCYGCVRVHFFDRLPLDPTVPVQESS